MKRTSLTPWLFLAPALIATVFLVLGPVLETFYLSLHDVVLFRPRTRPFVGLAHYAALLQDEVFWSSLGRSVVWVGAAVGLQFALGLTAVALAPLY